MRSTGAAIRWLTRATAAGLMVAVLVLGWTAPIARADGAWLDDQSVTWNRPGMPFPHPVQNRPGPMQEADTRCAAMSRPAETDEDRAVERAGWALFGAYASGWGTRVVQGMATVDGMSRPLEFQVFVFVGGKLAGTLSQGPMDSRTDGALTRVDMYAGDRLTAQFVQYTGQDALCCPSALSTVTYRIDRDGAAPVILRENTLTEKTAAAP